MGALEADAIQARPLWQEVTEGLRLAILTGALSPGTTLAPSELSERYGTSRGPVREAIRELAREGLVIELPRRRAIVSSLGLADLSEVHAVREVIEVGATKVVVARATEDELAALAAHLDALGRAPGSVEGAVHDLAFHRALVQITRNTRLTVMHEQMLAQTMLVIRTFPGVAMPTHMPLHARVHRDVLEALVARDEPRSTAAIAAHYRYARDCLVRVLPPFG